MAEAASVFLLRWPHALASLFRESGSIFLLQLKNEVVEQLLLLRTELDMLEHALSPFAVIGEVLLGLLAFHHLSRKPRQLSTKARGSCLEMTHFPGTK